MKQLFPIEIQEDTLEHHFVKRHTTSKIIYWIILFVLIIIIGSLPLIIVDVTSQSRSIMRNSEENITLQSTLYGKITDVSIFENKFVNEGDTLLWINVDEQNQQISRLQERIIENSEFIEDISKLIAGNYNVKTPKYITELAEYRGKTSEREVSLNQAKREYEVSKKLYEKGVESQYEYELNESRFHSEKKQIESLTYQYRNMWSAEKTKLDIENKSIYSEVQQIEKRKVQYFIVAPSTGHIVQYVGLNVGSFITPGQTIAQITSSDSLLVECYVSHIDIGYIKEGQQVKLQVDAFNYQQWGLLDGIVTEILPDVVQIENQSYFRVRCSLNKYYLELSSGYKGYLKKGMSATTRFILTRRSLAQILFDKIDDWVNPKIIQNGN